ncbi:MAG: hypothetical protein JNJ42_11285 [Burkholderiaceae bacterium]|nr:hypothetical protein [Burkholderiaceae bacterium]
MNTLAQTLYLDSAFGVALDVPNAGCSLENPFVYDAVARELKAMADRGLIEIVSEHHKPLGEDTLIDRLQFKRLR